MKNYSMNWRNHWLGVFEKEEGEEGGEEEEEEEPHTQ